MTFDVDQRFSDCSSDMGDFEFFHYTSVSSLLSIIESQKIRFTHIGALNDADEMMRGLHLLETHFPKKDFSLLHLYIGNFKNRLRCADYKNSILPFVFSLSKENDNLPMLRGYAKDGAGVIIKFNKYSIENINKNLYFQSCAYSNNYVHSSLTDGFIVKFIDAMYEFYQGKSIDDNQGIEFLGNAQRAIAIAAASIKNSDFKYEREIRGILFPKSEDIKFIERDSKIVPYVDVPINQDCITEIIVGPKFPDESFNFLKLIGPNKLKEGMPISRISSSYR